MSCDFPRRIRCRATRQSCYYKGVLGVIRMYYSLLCRSAYPVPQVACEQTDACLLIVSVVKDAANRGETAMQHGRTWPCLLRKFPPRTASARRPDLIEGLWLSKDYGYQGN